MASCSLATCENPTHARGLCVTHYSRWRLHGSPLIVMVPPSLPERFWAKVQQRGPHNCWPWAGALTDWGYGKIGDHGRTLRAHRVSWELHFGPVPPDKRVLHKCDNPPCVNPAHLFLGSLSDNTRDMVAKGRQSKRRARGSNHHAAKLTEASVAEIRRRYAAGETNKAALARAYGVTDVLIGQVVRGEGWVHVGGHSPTS